MFLESTTKQEKPAVLVQQYIKSSYILNVIFLKRDETKERKDLSLYTAVLFYILLLLFIRSGPNLLVLRTFVSHSVNRPTFPALYL